MNISLSPKTQFLAKMELDKRSANDGRPVTDTVGEHIQSGIPGLREELPKR
jgi:hypothetical protein